MSTKRTAIIIMGILLLLTACGEEKSKTLTTKQTDMLVSALESGNFNTVESAVVDLSPDRAFTSYIRDRLYDIKRTYSDPELESILMLTGERMKTSTWADDMHDFDVVLWNAEREFTGQVPSRAR